MTARSPFATMGDALSALNHLGERERSRHVCRGIAFDAGYDPAVVNGREGWIARLVKGERAPELCQFAADVLAKLFDEAGDRRMNERLRALLVDREAEATAVCLRLFLRDCDAYCRAVGASRRTLSRRLFSDATKLDRLADGSADLLSQRLERAISDLSLLPRQKPLRRMRQRDGDAGVDAESPEVRS